MVQYVRRLVRTKYGVDLYDVSVDVERSYRPTRRMDLKSESLPKPEPQRRDNMSEHSAPNFCYIS